jgi:biopolymer transport protein ExbB
VRSALFFDDKAGQTVLLPLWFLRGLPMDLLLKGGVLVWPILLCSFVGMTVFFERLLCYRTASRLNLPLIHTVCQLIGHGKIDEARHKVFSPDSRVAAGTSPVIRIIREGLAIDGRDRETLETVLSHAVSQEMKFLERHLNTLSTMSSTAPLLGLLGTVFGMIKAFIAVEQLGGRVNASVLAGGIWEAMLTTAFGLVVAIPLIIFHSYLEERLQTIQALYEDIAVSLVKAWSLVGKK